MENDLIRRGALLEKAAWMVEYDESGCGFDLKAVPIEDVLKAPAVDAVAVVCCKDCKHYGLGACLKIYSDGAASVYAWQYRKPDDFCSYGERRADT